MPTSCPDGVLSRDRTLILDYRASVPTEAVPNPAHVDNRLDSAWVYINGIVRASDVAGSPMNMNINTCARLNFISSGECSGLLGKTVTPSIELEREVLYLDIVEISEWSTPDDWRQLWPLGGRAQYYGSDHLIDITFTGTSVIHMYSQTNGTEHTYDLSTFEGMGVI